MGKSITQMREAISRCYDGDRWKERCKKMAPTQVWAIYHRFIKDGILDKQGRPVRFQEPTKESVLAKDVEASYRIKLGPFNKEQVESIRRNLEENGYKVDVVKNSKDFESSEDVYNKQMDFFDEIYKQLNKEN